MIDFHIFVSFPEKRFLSMQICNFCRYQEPRTENENSSIHNPDTSIGHRDTKRSMFNSIDVLISRLDSLIWSDSFYPLEASETLSHKLNIDDSFKNKLDFGS